VMVVPPLALRVRTDRDLLSRGPEQHVCWAA
jgi:hypothetical protein